MKIVKWYIKLLIGGMILSLIVFVFLNIMDFMPEYPDIAHDKKFLEMNFQKRYRGIITDKYIDENNHNNETIEIRLNDSTEYYWTTYNSDESGFYGFIKINDSIIKRDWGFKFYIKRENHDTGFVVNPDYVDDKK
jgi:hypothetical protein